LRQGLLNCLNFKVRVCLPTLAVSFCFSPPRAEEFLLSPRFSFVFPSVRAYYNKPEPVSSSFCLYLYIAHALRVLNALKSNRKPNWTHYCVKCITPLCACNAYIINPKRNWHYESGVPKKNGGRYKSPEGRSLF